MGEVSPERIIGKKFKDHETKYEASLKKMIDRQQRYFNKLERENKLQLKKADLLRQSERMLRKSQHSLELRGTLFRNLVQRNQE